MRTLADIDNEIASVEQQIALRNALGFKMARTKAILDHDTSDMNRVYSALATAEQNRLAREAQEKARLAQQAFTTSEREAGEQFRTSEREATQEFQAQQNALNRKLQQDQIAKNMVIEQAKLLKDLQDRHAEWTEIKNQKNISDAKKTAAKTAVELARKMALESGVPEKDIVAWTTDEEKPEGGDGDPKPSDAFTVAANKLDVELDKAGTIKDPHAASRMVDKFIAEYGDDPSTTDTIKKLKEKAAKRDKYWDGKAGTAKLVADLKRAAKKEKEKWTDPKQLALEVQKLYVDGKKPYYLPGYPNAKISVEEATVDGNDALIRRYGNTPIDTLLFR
jgi:hypothetical protein